MDFETSFKFASNFRPEKNVSFRLSGRVNSFSLQSDLQTTVFFETTVELEKTCMLFFFVIVLYFPFMKFPFTCFYLCY